MNKLPLIVIMCPCSIQPPRHSKSETDDNKMSQMNNFDIAIDYYTKGIINDKSNTNYLIKRATCYLAKGYYTLALKDALQTIEINPKFSKGYYIAAISYLEMKDIENAERYSQGSNLRLTVLIEKNKKEISKMCKKFKLYPKYLHFIRELYKYDSFFPKLEIKFFSDNNRGVVARTAIKRFEIIMTIPKPCLISMDVAFETEIGKEVQKIMYKCLRSPKHCLFSSFLLTEENNPKWKFYFDMLPQDFSYFPIFYTEKELDLLKGSPFLSQIYDKKIEMKLDYDQLCLAIPSFSHFSFVKFCQARMAVSSRIFGVCMNEKMSDVLVPYADLINHRRPRQTQWYYDDAINSFVIQALEDIKEGNEIFDSYGKKSNSMFLLNYGFCLENNDADDYCLKLNFNPNVPLFDEKKIVFLNESDYVRTFILTANIYESEITEVLSFLRFLIYDGDINLLYQAMNTTNIEEMCSNEPVSFYYIEPFSKELEIKVLKHFNWILREALRRYPTSIEEDKMLLKNKKNISFNMRNCLLLVMSEKKILIYYIYFCEYCLSLFKLSESEIINKLSNDYKYTTCQFSVYIEEVILKLIRM